MIGRLLPGHIDNTCSGHPLAAWILGAVVFFKGAMGLNSIFNGEKVARSADGIPLDAFTPAGAQAVLSFLGLWGWSLFLFSLLGALVLLRYRAMIPLMFALLLLEQLGRKLILQVMPIVGAGAPSGSAINLVLTAAMVLGLALSLWRRVPPGAPTQAQRGVQ